MDKLNKLNNVADTLAMCGYDILNIDENVGVVYVEQDYDDDHDRRVLALADEDGETVTLEYKHNCYYYHVLDTVTPKIAEINIYRGSIDVHYMHKVEVGDSTYYVFGGLYDNVKAFVINKYAECQVISIDSYFADAVRFGWCAGDGLDLVQYAIENTCDIEILQLNKKCSTYKKLALLGVTVPDYKLGYRIRGAENAFGFMGTPDGSLIYLDLSSEQVDLLMKCSDVVTVDNAGDDLLYHLGLKWDTEEEDEDYPYYK